MVMTMSIACMSSVLQGNELNADLKTQSTHVANVMRELKQQSQARGWKATKSCQLRCHVLAMEEFLVEDLRKAGLPLERYRVGDIAKELQTPAGEDIIVSWKIRNKAALKLLEYWRQNPSQMINDESLLVYSEKTNEMTYKELFSILCKNESLLQHYIKTPLAETNWISFEMIDPNEYPINTNSNLTRERYNP